MDLAGEEDGNTTSGIPSAQLVGALLSSSDVNKLLQGPSSPRQEDSKRPTDAAGRGSGSYSAKPERSTETVPDESATPIREVDTTMVRAWGIAKRFEVSSTEDAYVRYRRQENFTRGQRIWLCYAVLLLVLLAIAIADLRGPTAAFGCFGLVVAVLLAVGTGLGPQLVAIGKNTARRMVWQSVGLLIPVLVMFSCALTRPTIIGNDIRDLFLFSPFLRFYCLPTFDAELILTPVLLFISSLQYQLPGGVMRLVFGIYGFVLWAVYVDAGRDAKQREEFAALIKLQHLFPVLAKEERLRMGLLKSTLPLAVYDHYAPEMGLTLEHNASSSDAQTSGSGHFNIGGDPFAVNATEMLLVPNMAEATRLKMINDTTVVVVRALPEEGLSGAARLMDGPSFAAVEQALRSNDHLSIVTVSGDVAVLVSPIFVQHELVRVSRDKERVLGAAVLSMLEIPLEARLSALIDFDMTLQLLQLGAFPRFTLLGATLRRQLSVTTTVETPPGVLLSGRAARTLDSSVETAGRFTTQPLDAWAVRNVGLVRYHRASIVGGSDSHHSERRSTTGGSSTTSLSVFTLSPSVEGSTNAGSLTASSAAGGGRK